MLDLEHVGIGLGELVQQRGQRAGAVGDAQPQREVAAGGDQAVPDHPQHQQRVDVAAGQHARPPAARRRRGRPCSAATAAAPAGSTTSLARSRHSSSARDSDSSETVTTSSDQLRDVLERHVAGPADGDAVGHRRHAGQLRPGRRRRARAGRRRRPPPARRPPARPGAAPSPPRRSPASSPPPPAATTMVRDLGALLQDLQADRALAGDHVRVVEGVDEAPRRSRSANSLAATSASSTVCPAKRTSRRRPRSPRPWAAARPPA